MAEVGIECVAYYNDGTIEAPIWVDIPLAKDVTLNLGASEANTDARLSRLKTILAAMLDISFDLEMLYDTTDPAFTDLLSTFIGLDSAELAFMDGPIATPGSQGPRILCAITKFNRKEPLEGAVTVEITAKPAYGAVATWYTVPG